MPLQPGTRIGGYEISALIGAGGMGEVYRARDLRLGRDVAIKILSPSIAADADALMRFDREARALASLNHPNIAAIYGVEESTGQPALILEFVEGETLADRLARGALPVAQAVDYAKQIADALDVAHEAAIVHRDLKPGNIKLTDDERIKILDFGLAKAIAAASGGPADIDPANSPTITVQGTQHGVILGTAAYMSPEQARAKRIDKRTDIWAFGCVLFEMLTGRRAFTGETTSDVIAAIIERAPDLSLLPRSTPAHVRRVIERCLEKDPKRRARDIADVRSDLDPPAALAPATQRSWLLPAAATAVAVAAIAVAAWAWSSRTAMVAPPAGIELQLAAPSGYTLLPFAGALSPDGTRIAFLASDERKVPSIFVRPLDSAVARRLDGTEGVTTLLAWSPDGRSIAFFVNGVWKRIAAEGGPPVTIVANVAQNIGASWGQGDVLLLSPTNRTSLARVAATGGTLQPVTSLDTAKDNSHRWPFLLPDGRHFLFTVRSDSPERLGIKLGDLDSSDVRALVNVASQGVYAAPGWLLYVTTDEVLMAQRLDTRTWSLQGTPQPVTGPVRYNGPSFFGGFDASADGRVITYLPSVRAGSTLEWFDRTGKPLGRVGPERDFRGVRLSRDGRLVAVELSDPQLGTRDLWLLDTSTNGLTRLTSHPATDWRAVFAPDGTSLAFASDRAGLSTVFRGSIRNPGAETVLYRDKDGGSFPSDWSRDGRSLLVAHDDRDGRPSVIALVPLDGGPQSTLVENERAESARLSPDGSRIVFMMSVEGQPEIYVMSIANKERIRVSTDGGHNPFWGADGREVFFLNRNSELMRAVVDEHALAGPPQLLLRLCASLGRTFSSTPAETRYGVSADATRFLAVCDAPGTVPSAINVIVNWQNTLK